MNSTLKTTVKTSTQCPHIPPKTSKLERATTNRYAIAMLNKVASLRPEDIDENTSQSPYIMVKRASLDGLEEISLNGGHTSPIERRINFITITRNFLKRAKSGEACKTTQIKSIWELARGNRFPEEVRIAFDAAMENLVRIVKF